MLDTTALESFPSLISHGINVAGEISAPPSFQLPNSNDVSTFFNFLIMKSFIAKKSVQTKFRLMLEVIDVFNTFCLPNVFNFMVLKIRRIFLGFMFFVKLEMNKE